MSLPILSSQFFEKHAPDLGFFSKWRAFFDWNAQIVPIYEWQDILYVGCLQPPPQFPQSSYKTVFILCDPESLKRVWNDFEGTVADQISPSLQFSSPESVFKVPSVPVIDETPAEFVLDLTEPIVPVKTETNPGIALKIDAPIEIEQAIESDSLSMDFQTETAAAMEEPISSEIELSFDEVSQNTSAGGSIAIPQLEGLDEKTETPAPEFSIELDASQTATEISAAPEASNQDLSVETEIIIDAVESEIAIEPESSASPAVATVSTVGKPTASAELSLEEALAASSDSEPAAEAPSIMDENSGLLDLDLGTPSAPVSSGQTNSSPLVSLQPLSESPLKASNPLTDKTEPIFPQKDAAATAKTEDLTPLDTAALAAKRAAPSKSEVLLKGDGSDKSDVTRISIQALNSKTQEQVDNWTETLFASLGENFKKSMILLKSGDQVKPWKWDGNFQPATPAISSVSLLQPSPFRIVHRTHKPFHGFVSANDLNQKFFDQWNNSEIPEHLTVAPVMVDDHVIGMLLAIGDKSADTKACLQSVELLAAGIAKEVTASRNKAA